MQFALLCSPAFVLPMAKTISWPGPGPDVYKKIPQPSHDDFVEDLEATKLGNGPGKVRIFRDTQKNQAGSIRKIFPNNWIKSEFLGPKQCFHHSNTSIAKRRLGEDFSGEKRRALRN